MENDDDDEKKPQAATMPKADKNIVKTDEEQVEKQPKIWRVVREAFTSIFFFFFLVGLFFFPLPAASPAFLEFSRSLPLFDAPRPI